MRFFQDTRLSLRSPFGGRILWSCLNDARETLSTRYHVLFEPWDHNLTKMTRIENLQFNCLLSIVCTAVQWRLTKSVIRLAGVQYWLQKVFCVIQWQFFSLGAFVSCEEKASLHTLVFLTLTWVSLRHKNFRVRKWCQKFQQSTLKSNKSQNLMI